MRLKCLYILLSFLFKDISSLIPSIREDTKDLGSSHDSLGCDLLPSSPLSEDKENALPPPPVISIAAPSAQSYFKEGTFFGHVIHKSGTSLGWIHFDQNSWYSFVKFVSFVEDVSYAIKRVAVEDNGFVICIWISLINDELTASSADVSWSLSSPSTPLRGPTLTQAIKGQAYLKGEDSIMVRGEYEDHYVTLEQIGKGAFGCVKFGYRKADKRLVRRPKRL